MKKFSTKEETKEEYHQVKDIHAELPMLMMDMMDLGIDPKCLFKK